MLFDFLPARDARREHRPIAWDARHAMENAQLEGART